MSDTAERVLAAIGSDPTQAFVLVGPTGRPQWASPSLLTLVGLDLSAPDPFADALHPDDAALVDDILRAEQSGPADASYTLDRRFELLVRLRSPAGEWRWVSLRLHNRVDDPVVQGMVLQLTLANQEHSTVEAFDAAALGAPTVEVIGRVLETLSTGGTGAAQAVVFGPDGTCVATTPGAGIAIGDRHDGEAWRSVSGGRVDVDLPVVGPSGRDHGRLVTVSNFPDVRPFTRSLAASVARRVGLLLDAAEARAELHRQAVTDPLTGLPNRRAVYELLERAGPDGFVSVAFVDLDGFKQVNDELGHHVGDGVLVDVAARLRAAVRDGDLLARVGGDEFVLVRPGATPASSTIDATVLQRCVACEVRGTRAGHTLLVRASVGVATGPAVARLDLLVRADAAMYAAKAASSRDRSGAEPPEHVVGDPLDGRVAAGEPVRPVGAAGGHHRAAPR